ncbi:MAG: hypothetical protein D6689_11285 [Deltaproteobacteria bacterium]|nr:MAG: hypothetical protein D6689_11285 [Deltaproteobacteria bacterium]
MVAATLAAGCGTQSESQKKEEAPPPAPATTAESTASAEPADAAPAADTEADRKRLVDRALARVPQIEEGVAKLRGRPFRSPVPAEYQDQDAFRAFVRQEIARELPPEKNRNLGRALAHLGLIDKPLDLAKVAEDAMVSQAGAYYDPKQKKFFVVMVPGNDMMLDTISSHELTHALQDQYFDLERFYYGHDGDGPPKYSEDELNARRFLVEGEATFVMVAYMAYAMAKVNMLEPKLVGQLRPQIDQFANMTIDQLRAMTKQQASALGELGDDFKRSIDALDSIPLYVLVPLLASYTKGVLPVYEAYVAGGWDAVDALYKNPPASTEQVLHPADKLVRTRDEPVHIALAAPRGAAPIHEETIGELGWRVYFMQWQAADPVGAAAGWDGDRVAVYERDGALVGLIATTWDTNADAKEFAEAYIASLDKRFPGAEKADARIVTTVTRPDGGKVLVQRKGQHVFIVDGGTEADLKLVTRARMK